MLNKARLNEIARLKGLTLENCEKDYFQDVLLFNIYRELGRELVFKGGTCLYKIFKLGRFSEDLDFTATKKIDISKVLKKVLYSINSLNIGVSVREISEFQNQTNVRLAFRGPLYNGAKESMATIILNLSSRERVLIEPRRATIAPLYEDVPSFEVFAMDEREILVEKIRAILERNKARDVYDLWFLLKIKNVPFDEKLLSKKVGKASKKGFIEKLAQKKQEWNKELKQFLTTTPPSFEQAKKDIEEKMFTTGASNGLG